MVYAAALVQGVALVTFPAASSIFTSPAHYGLSTTQYGSMFLPQVVTAITASLLGARLARRFGLKRVFVAGLLADLVSMGLLVTSQFFTSTQALAYARHADDHALAAEILAAQAHQALYLARPDEAVDLARAAQAAAVRHGSATLLTECLVMEAHGHAARNDARACGAVLARAEQTFDRAAREDDPAWLAYFDEAYLAARMAQ